MFCVRRCFFLVVCVFAVLLRDSVAKDESSCDQKYDDVSMLQVPSHVSPEQDSQPGCEKAFESFVQRFDKHYQSSQERKLRYQHFKATYDFVTQENAKGSNSYAIGINGFADQTPEEFTGTYLGSAMPQKPLGDLALLGTHEYSGNNLSANVDWVSKGAVTPVSFQGPCLSSWAFSTTGGLEGAWQIATGKLLNLSVQQLIDCSGNGCDGGWSGDAYEFTEKFDVCTASSYPYQAVEWTHCRMKDTCTVGIPSGNVIGHKRVAKGNVKALMEAVAKQPVSVLIDYSEALRLYVGGVLEASCHGSADHAALLVGYGTIEGELKYALTHSLEVTSSEIDVGRGFNMSDDGSGLDYWKLKNYWGSMWGDEGYFYVARVGYSPDGIECGYSPEGVYPQVSLS